MNDSNTTTDRAFVLNASNFVAGSPCNTDNFSSISTRFDDCLAWLKSVDWQASTERDRTYTHEAIRAGRIFDIRMVLQHLTTALEIYRSQVDKHEVDHVVGSSNRTDKIIHGLEIGLRGVGPKSVRSHVLTKALVALAEKYVLVAGHKQRKVRGRAFGNKWTTPDMTSILKPFTKTGTRKRIIKAYVPTSDYDPALHEVPFLENQDFAGYEVLRRTSDTTVTGEINKSEIVHGATYRFFTTDNQQIFDVIPIDPAVVRDEEVRAVPQVFVVLQSGAQVHGIAAIVDRRGTVLFKGQGIHLVESLIEQVKNSEELLNKSNRKDGESLPYLIYKNQDTNRTPLFDLDAVREASRPNTEKQKYDDLIASALANPEIRELAGRLLVKIADHVRR